jgi:hypothetical protein
MNRCLSAALAAMVLALLAVVPGTAQGPHPGFADPVLGRWDLTVQGASGTTYPSWLEVTLRKETELMGRFVGQFGSVRYVTGIAFRDGELTFAVPVQYEPHKEDLRFRGRLTGETLEGTTEDAAGKTISWKGVRAPLMLPAASPRWGTPLELFNGKDVAGWKLRSAEKAGCWQVTDGLLTSTPPCVDLVSEKTFGDFRLQAEFMYPEKSNSGIYLRGRYEVQIQDDAGRALSALRMGGVYGFLTPYYDAARRAGEWQTFDITLIGRRVSVVLNGTTIIRDETIPGITGGALDSDEGTPGPLLLQGDHGKISFRKITVSTPQ